MKPGVSELLEAMGFQNEVSKQIAVCFRVNVMIDGMIVSKVLYNENNLQISTVSFPRDHHMLYINAEFVYKQILTTFNHSAVLLMQSYLSECILVSLTEIFCMFNILSSWNS